MDTETQKEIKRQRVIFRALIIALASGAILMVVGSVAYLILGPPSRGEWPAYLILGGLTLVILNMAVLDILTRKRFFRYWEAERKQREGER